MHRSSLMGNIRTQLEALWRRWRGKSPAAATGPLRRGPRLVFADFELEVDSGRLLRDGEPVKLQPQPARALEYLAERWGRLVTREELRQHLWGDDHYVNYDQGLNFCVQQIRQALGDSAQEPMFVETLLRKGYRFLVAVERHEEEGPRDQRSTSRWAATFVLAAALFAGFWGAWGEVGDEAEAPPRLVVLPFDVEGPEGDALGALASQRLSGELARSFTGRLGVVPPPPATRTGETVAADLVVRGGAARDGDRIRVLVRLIDAANEEHLWAGAYDTAADVRQWSSWITDAALHIAETTDSADHPGRVAGGGLLDSTRSAVHGLAARFLGR